MSRSFLDELVTGGGHDAEGADRTGPARRHQPVSLDGVRLGEGDQIVVLEVKGVRCFVDAMTEADADRTIDLDSQVTAQALFDLLEHVTTSKYRLPILYSVSEPGAYGIQ